MPYLNREQIINLIKKKYIISYKPLFKNQIQPASLDLTLSNKCFRIKASFIPNKNKISEIIKDLSLNKINLNKASFRKKLYLLVQIVRN